MKYRSVLTEVIRDVILRAREDLAGFIQGWTDERIPEHDRQRFLNLVLAEPKGLHAGNIARFRLRPSEFAAWQNKVKL